MEQNIIKKEKDEYWLIVKKIKEMLKYHNTMLKQFPKEEKFLLASRIRDFGYKVFEGAITVNKKFHKKTTLSEMNVNHELLRQFINLAFEMKYIDSQKHRVSQLHVDEVGKMLGAWIKQEIN